MKTIQIAAISTPGESFRELKCALLSYGYGVASIGDNLTMLVIDQASDDTFYDNIINLCKHFGKEWCMPKLDFLDNYNRMGRWPIVETGKKIKRKIRQKEHEG